MSDLACRVFTFIQEGVPAGSYEPAGASRTSGYCPQQLKVRTLRQRFRSIENR